MKVLQETSDKDNDEQWEQVASRLGKQIERRSRTIRGDLIARKRGQITEDLSLATKPISPLAAAIAGKNAKHNLRRNKVKKVKRQVSRPYIRELEVSLVTKMLTGHCSCCNDDTGQPRSGHFVKYIRSCCSPWELCAAHPRS